MDIENMTLDDFKKVPCLKWNEPDIEIDSLVLIPTKEVYEDTCWAYYDIVVCKDGKAIGRTGLYDTHSIFCSGEYERVGIDCLGKSGLMRIFLEQNVYVFQNGFHNTINKNSKNYYKIKGEEDE